MLRLAKVTFTSHSLHRLVFWGTVQQKTWQEGKSRQVG